MRLLHREWTTKPTNHRTPLQREFRHPLRITAQFEIEARESLAIRRTCQQRRRATSAPSGAYSSNSHSRSTPQESRTWDTLRIRNRQHVLKNHLRRREMGIELQCPESLRATRAVRKYQAPTGQNRRWSLLCSWDWPKKNPRSTSKI